MGVRSVPVAEVAPTARDVLALMGVPAGVPVSGRLRALTEAAIRTLGDLARPRLVVEPISLADFMAVFEGEGANAPDSVVGRVAPRAEALALYAATLGPAPGRRVTELLDAHDVVAGSLLDAAASCAADALTGAAATRMAPPAERAGRATHVVGYSPGYCGWDVTGQRRLFAVLRPGRIGVTLEERCLMTPIKSVSGVLLSGPTPIHEFSPGFSFCEPCKDRTCAQRIRGLHGLDRILTGGAA